MHIIRRTQDPLAQPTLRVRGEAYRALLESDEQFTVGDDDGQTWNVHEFVWCDDDTPSDVALWGVRVMKNGRHTTTIRYIGRCDSYGETVLNRVLAAMRESGA